MAKLLGMALCKTVGYGTMARNGWGVAAPATNRFLTAITIPLPWYTLPCLGTPRPALVHPGTIITCTMILETKSRFHDVKMLTCIIQLHASWKVFNLLGFVSLNACSNLFEFVVSSQHFCSWIWQLMQKLDAIYSIFKAVIKEFLLLVENKALKHNLQLCWGFFYGILCHFVLH